MPRKRFTGSLGLCLKTKLMAYVSKDILGWGRGLFVGVLTL